MPEIAEAIEQSFKNVDGMVGAAIFSGGVNTESMAAALQTEKEKSKVAYEKFKAAMEGSDTLKTKERDPEALQAFIEGTAGVNDDIFISPEGVKILFQKYKKTPEVAEQILRDIGIDPEVAADNVKEGLDIPVKLSMVASHLNAEQSADLVNDLKAAPGAMTFRESKQVDEVAEAQRIEDSLKEQNIIFDHLRRIRGEMLDAGLTTEYVDHAVALFDMAATRWAGEAGFTAEDFLSRVSVGSEVYETFMAAQKGKVLAQKGITPSERLGSALGSMIQQIEEGRGDEERFLESGETEYIGSSAWRIYDKREQIKSNNHKKIKSLQVLVPENSLIRIERILKPLVTFPELVHLPNPFEKLTVTAYSHLKTEGDHWRLFLGFAQHAGAQAALLRIQDKRLRAKFKKKLDLGQGDWFTPELIWNQLPGLLADIIDPWQMTGKSAA